MLYISDIAKDSVFYEIEYGCTDKYVAICSPCRRDGGWAVYAKPADRYGRPVEGSERIKFYTRDGYEHYVKLYSDPSY